MSLTQDEIISMAREAGGAGGVGFEIFVERFAALVVAHEREACAKVCEYGLKGAWDGDECAAAIRARSEE